MVNLVTNNWAVISLGVGVTFLLVSGNFDLSVGGVVALSGVLAVWLAQSTGGANPLSTGLGLPYLARHRRRAGRRAGDRGAECALRRAVPRPVDHRDAGTMMLARGMAQVITHGSQRNTNLPVEFGVLGNLTMLGTSIKLPVVLMAALLIVAVFIEKKTVFGRHHLPDRRQPGGGDAVRASTVRATSPGSISSARRSPASVGILLASEFKSGYSNRGTLMEFDALVVALLGGVAIAGGFGSVLGMFFGAMILAVVTSAATGLLLSPDWQFILKAIAVFLAIMTQTWALARRNR